MSTSEENEATGCVLASDLGENKLVLEMQQQMKQMRREMEAYRQKSDQAAAELEEFKSKMGRNKTLTCRDCKMAIEDKRAFWCSDCHGQLKFDVKDLMDDEKHLISCSAQFMEMAIKTEQLEENWPTLPLDTYLKEIIGQQLSNAKENSKKCKSRVAFKEFYEKSQEIAQKAEKRFEEMKNVVNGFVAELEAFGTEFDDLQKNGDLFNGVDSNIRSIQSSLPITKSNPPIATDLTWNINEKMPLKDPQVHAVFCDRENLLVFWNDLMFHALLSESPSNAVSFKSAYLSDLFFEITTAKLIPKTSILLFHTSKCPSRFVVYDLQKSFALQKLYVDSDIRGIDCSEEFVVISTRSKTILYSFSDGQLTRLRLFPGQTGTGTAMMSRSGILAYSNGNIILYDTKKLETISEALTGSRFQISNDGSRLFFCQDNREELYFSDASDPSRSSTIPITFSNSVSSRYGQSQSMGQLQNAVSDDNRSFAFLSGYGLAQYTIVTLNYDSLNRPSLFFAFQFEVKGAVFEESVAFIRVDGVQHLQFVTREGVLVRYKIDEDAKAWTKL